MKTPWCKPGRVPSARSSRRSARRVFSCLAISCLLLFPATKGWAQKDEEAEYRVKLAFLYNFAQFTQWPPEAFHDPSSPLTLCVAGPNPFQGEIEQGLRGRSVGGHPVEIRRLRPNDDPRTCHVIFVRATEKKLAEKLLSEIKGSSILTVGESKAFEDLGGVINLTLEENKLRFEINLDAARQTRLKISSKLLALAKIVKLEPAP